MHLPTTLRDAALAGAASGLAVGLYGIPIAHAAEVQIQAQGPVVEITAVEQVQSAPDEATVSAGVTTRAKTAVESMRLNAARMTTVVARIKSLGVAAEDIQTSGVSLSPSYQYNPNGQSTFLGYDVTNQVGVTLRKIGNVGEVLDALVAAGANNINGPMFRMNDPRPAVEAARKKAVEAARLQATDHAKLVGYSGVKLLSVEESESQYMPSEIVVTGRQLRAQAISASTPVEPGRVSTQVRILARYEMTR